MTNTAFLNALYPDRQDVKIWQNGILSLSHDVFKSTVSQDRSPAWLNDIAPNLEVSGSTLTGNTVYYIEMPIGKTL